MAGRARAGARPRPPGLPRTSSRCGRRWTEQLIIEESRHEALEEMYFWPAVRDRLESGDTLADEATGQEQDAKAGAGPAWTKLGPDDGEFEQLLGKFHHGRPRAHRVSRSRRSGR